MKIEELEVTNDSLRAHITTLLAEQRRSETVPLRRRTQGPGAETDVWTAAATGGATDVDIVDLPPLEIPQFDIDLLSKITLNDIWLVSISAGSSSSFWGHVNFVNRLVIQLRTHCINTVLCLTSSFEFIEFIIWTGIFFTSTSYHFSFCAKKYFAMPALIWVLDPTGKAFSCSL